MNVEIWNEVAPVSLLGIHKSDPFCSALFQVVFEAVRGEQNNGYVALDELLVVEDATCETRPADATPTPSPDTTTPPLPDHFPSCDFEADLCGWTLDEVNWKFER